MPSKSAAVALKVIVWPRAGVASEIVKLAVGSAFWTVTCSVTAAVPLAESVTVSVTVLAPSAVAAAYAWATFAPLPVVPSPKSHA